MRQLIPYAGILLLVAPGAQAHRPPARPAPPATPYTLLQGIWAANTEDNAVFWVRGTRLTYVEFLDRPLRYTLTPTILTIMQVDGAYPCHLRKLTADSLVYENPYGRVERLYKRK